MPAGAGAGVDAGGDARASTVRQSLDTQADSLRASGVTRVFAEKISTRALTRPELDKAVALAREIRASGAAVTIVVHEHKRLGRGIELAALAEQLRADGIGLEFLTGELQGSHDPSGVVFTVLAALSGSDREYIRDRTLEGHESARARGKSIGGAAVTDDAMLAVALHLRGQELSLRDIAGRLVIATGKKKGQHPSPATVMRMLREHDEKVGLASVTTSFLTLHWALACYLTCLLAGGFLGWSRLTVLPTSWRVAGWRFFEPGGRPGPGLPGFGALARPGSAWRMFRNPRRTRAGVSRPAGQGRCQGSRMSAARPRASQSWA